MRPNRPNAPAQEGSDVALNPEYGNLPDTPGVEDTFYLCSACHSLAIIKQQRVPPRRWDYLWNWMIEKQGMPEQDVETKQAILTYLKRHFSGREYNEVGANSVTGMSALDATPLPAAEPEDKP